MCVVQPPHLVLHLIDARIVTTHEDAAVRGSGDGCEAYVVGWRGVQDRWVNVQFPRCALALTQLNPNQVHHQGCGQYKEILDAWVVHP